MTFLFAGRLVGLKGVDILLDAFAAVTATVPAQLEIIGDGPEHASLVAQAARLGLSHSVSFLGWLGPQECASRMRDCDVFVSASLQEAGGIAILEAMACGRPVIASAWGGHLATIGDAAGELIDVSSRPALVTGFTDAMVRLASDNDLRSRLGAAGRSRVETRYDWDVLIDTTLGIYDHVRGAAAAASRDAPHSSSANMRLGSG